VHSNEPHLVLQLPCEVALEKEVHSIVEIQNPSPKRKAIEKQNRYCSKIDTLSMALVKHFLPLVLLLLVGGNNTFAQILISADEEPYTPRVVVPSNPEEHNLLLIEPNDTTENWSFSLDFNKEHFTLYFNGDHVSFDDCIRLTKEEGADNSCEDAYMLLSQSTVTSLFLRAKKCYGNEAGINGFSSDTVSQFSALIVITTIGMTQTYVGHATASPAMLRTEYSSLQAMEYDWDAISSPAPTKNHSSSKGSGAAAEQLPVVVNEDELDMRAWNQEQGWELTVKDSIASLDYLDFKDVQLKQRSRVIWRYKNEPCLSIEQFMSNALVVVVLTVNHRSTACGCKRGASVAPCACSRDTKGGGTFGMYLHVYAEAGFFGLTGCGVKY